MPRTEKNGNWHIYRVQEVLAGRGREVLIEKKLDGIRRQFKHPQAKSTTNQQKGTKTKRKDLKQSWRGRGKVFHRAINRQMENNRATHARTQDRINTKMLPTGQSCLTIYHIPSVFFNELVERDRGLRMILMVWLFLPHSCTLHLQACTHEVTHTHTPFRATWSPLTTDHSPHWSEVTLREPSFLRDSFVEWSKIIPHLWSSSSSDRLTGGGCSLCSPSLSLRHSLALIFLGSECDLPLS